jgi:plastocyanin
MKMSTMSSLLLCAALIPAAARAETIEGAVEFTGKAPAMGKLHREADAFCAKKTMTDETVLLKGTKLQNVWVHVVKGAPESKGTGSVEMNQKDCMYRPRMTFAQVGQTIIAKNEDPTLHNVHTYLGAATLFNKGMPNASAKPIDYPIEKDGMMKWKCDVHPWMKGFVGVNKNPYQASTADKGDFKIDNVPPGKYTVAAWHEKYGEKTQEVTVEAGKPAKVTFKYDGTEKAL